MFQCFWDDIVVNMQPKSNLQKWLFTISKAVIFGSKFCFWKKSFCPKFQIGLIQKILDPDPSYAPFCLLWLEISQIHSFPRNLGQKDSFQEWISYFFTPLWTSSEDFWYFWILCQKMTAFELNSSHFQAFIFEDLHEIE